MADFKQKFRRRLKAASRKLREIRMVAKGLVSLRCQHRIPDSGRTYVFETSPIEVELTFVNPTKQFDA